MTFFLFDSLISNLLMRKDYQGCFEKGYLFMEPSFCCSLSPFLNEFGLALDDSDLPISSHLLVFPG